jgi:hypothetical protein
MAKHDIFISYRREGGFETAKMLQEKLKSLGYRVFLDFEELRSGKFNLQLYSKIEECKDFILICSPRSLERCHNEDDWLRLEIMHAIKHGKNIVPVLVRNFEFPKQMPDGMEELPLMHGIGASEELFDAFVAKLRKMFKSKANLTHHVLNSGFSTIPIALLAIFPLLITVSIFWYVKQTKPFHLSIAVNEVHAIPDFPFEKGTITLIFGNKSEHYQIEKEIFIKDIPPYYRGKKGKIRFEAFGFEPLDTIIRLEDNRTINIPIERDNSLGKIFGVVYDEMSNPLEGVHILVLDISTETDKYGFFAIDIPREKQKKEQNLRAIKDGFETYNRNSSFFSDKAAQIILKSKKNNEKN